MDNLNGLDPFAPDGNMPEPGYISFESEDSAIEPPPNIAVDERRMQVRAYNYWLSQLDGRDFPSIDRLDPDNVDDFKGYSVLLDFSSGIENPLIRYLGSELRGECGIHDDIHYLNEIPARSLLSRITDHYLQIIANRAPIGFEAEYTNDRSANILYRGILLPYSSDGENIDFIYGVINWKEIADQDLAASLSLEVGNIEAPIYNLTVEMQAPPPPADAPDADDDILELGSDQIVGEPVATADNMEEEHFPLTADNSLSQWLDAARHSAYAARDADARSREKLYAAIGQAYDFSLLAQKSPEEYEHLLTASGLTVQERAPMTPIVKLVFGADYDKTRLTEFAAALCYAHRNAVPMGDFAERIAENDGGLKAIVQAERMARKVERGDHVARTAQDPRIKLRVAPARSIDQFAGEGDEFVLLVARRDNAGNLALIGSVEGDGKLTERALRKTRI